MEQKRALVTKLVNVAANIWRMESEIQSTKSKKADPIDKGLIDDFKASMVLSKGIKKDKCDLKTLIPKIDRLKLE